MDVCMHPWFSPKWSHIVSLFGPWLFHFLTQGVTSPHAHMVELIHTV